MILFPILKSKTKKLGIDYQAINTNPQFLKTKTYIFSSNKLVYHKYRLIHTSFLRPHKYLTINTLKKWFVHETCV